MPSPSCWINSSSSTSRKKPFTPNLKRRQKRLKPDSSKSRRVIHHLLHPPTLFPIFPGSDRSIPFRPKLQLRRAKTQPPTKHSCPSFDPAHPGSDYSTIFSPLPRLRHLRIRTSTPTKKLTQRTIYKTPRITVHLRNQRNPRFGQPPRQKSQCNSSISAPLVLTFTPPPDRARGRVLTLSRGGEREAPQSICENLLNLRFTQRPSQKHRQTALDNPQHLYHNNNQAPPPTAIGTGAQKNRRVEGKRSFYAGYRQPNKETPVCGRDDTWIV